MSWLILVAMVLCCAGCGSKPTALYQEAEETLIRCRIEYHLLRAGLEKEHKPLVEKTVALALKAKGQNDDKLD